MAYPVLAVKIISRKTNKISAQLKLTEAEKNREYLFAKDARKHDDLKPDSLLPSLFEMIIVGVVILGAIKIYAFHKANSVAARPTVEQSVESRILSD